MCIKCTHYLLCTSPNNFGYIQIFCPGQLWVWLLFIVFSLSLDMVGNKELFFMSFGSAVTVAYVSCVCVSFCVICVCFGSYI